MSKNFVKFEFNDEQGGDGELTLSFKIDNFSGSGSAYFNASKILAGFNELTNFPLPAEGVCAVKGGFLSRDWSSNEISQEHLYFFAKPDGLTGKLVLTVRVAAPSDSSDKGVKCFGGGNLVTNYQELDNFVRDIEILLSGNCNEAILLETTS